MPKISITPNIKLTNTQIQDDRSFSSESFGVIHSVKQEIIQKYFKQINKKQKVVIKVRVK